VRGVWAGQLLTLVKACFLSVALHGALLFAYFYTPARSEVGALAQAPASDLHARIFSYQVIRAAAITSQQATLSAAPAAVAPTPLATAQVAAVAASQETIYDQSALDASPLVLSNVVLEYPTAADNREGLVSLEIVILGTGAVESVKVLKAEPAGFFEEAAITGFKNASFYPGMLGGLGVKSRMDIEVEFMPTNRGATVSGQR